MKEQMQRLLLGRDTNMRTDKTGTGLLKQLFQTVQHEDGIYLPEGQTFLDVKKLIS
jgi:hypothetical protein